MKKSTIYFLLMLCVLFSCKKIVRDDLHGNLYIQGRLFTVDSLDQNSGIIAQPLGGRSVEIGYASDSTINYLYKVTTDADGYFTFTTIDPTQTYVIFSRDTIGGVTYFNQSALIKTSVSIDNLVLKIHPSQIDQNGFVFTAIDSASKQPVNACSICLFRSHVLFEADTRQGATYTLTTNANGNAYQLNVAKGWYYANFKAVYVNGFVYSKDSVYVDTLGIARQTHAISFH